MRHAEVITSSSRLYEVYPRLRDAVVLAVDTETTGLSRFAEVIGISFSPNENEGYYIPIKVWRDEQLVSPWTVRARGGIRDIIEELLLKSKRLITHNGVFDARVIENSFGINIIGNILCDTQLLHHTLYSDPPHGLKPLAAAFIDPSAGDSQEDLKSSVLAHGGSWTKENKEFFKGDVHLLGRYGAFDTIWTMALYNKFWAEINEPKNAPQLKLFLEEVMPLQACTFEMETTGIRVDVEAAKELRVEMLCKVATIEDEIYAQMEDKIKDYELRCIFESVKLTTRSELGKLLISKGLPLDAADSKVKTEAYAWFTAKKQVRRVFNLDSGEDKAYLIYDVMGIPCPEFTASGKRSTAKSLMDSLAEKYAEQSPIIKMIRERSQELKLLNTYVESIIEDSIDGRIYPGFMQTGTTSGRYSSGGSSLNMQTLPRGDTRIKSLFIPDEGWSFIGADYSSLEPHAFAVASGEPKLKKIFTDGLDFYSSIAIDVLGLKGVSANPKDPNYLGTVDKEKRQWVKAIALSIPYGAEAGRLMQILGVEYDEAKEVHTKYLKAFPVLKKWMDKCVLEMKLNGFVDGMTGRRKRGDFIKLLYDKYKVRDFSKKALAQLYPRLPQFDGIVSSDHLFLECRNLLNVSRNHCIQSLAASICNMGMIKFQQLAKEKKLSAFMILSIHDEVIVTCPNDEAEVTAKLLEDCMINNKVTALLDIPLEAEPVITQENLAKAK